ncbi:Ubiquinone biosynthesis protein coq9, mitochondrial [Coemansia sp. BCRC 34490]|nr:Ubiquinone biosynthesis protein coq9, mitochondrial [Coemansia sp. BCRC 34490]
MNSQALRRIAKETAAAARAAGKHRQPRLLQRVSAGERHMSGRAAPDGEARSGASNTKTNAHLEILDLALTKVDGLGWTQQAVVSAANELGYSGMAGGVSGSGSSGGGGLGLVVHFMDRALDDTRIEADDQLHEFDNARDKLRFLCRVRLRMTQPYIRRWPEAAALLAQPQNVPTAMRCLGELSSQLWYLADDRSTHIDWYARRAALAAAYLSAELFMCEDSSPALQGTWDFLDRRIDDMDAAESASLKAAAFGQQFSRNLFNILASRGYVSH